MSRSRRRGIPAAGPPTQRVQWLRHGLWILGAGIVTLFLGALLISPVLESRIDGITIEELKETAYQASDALDREMGDRCDNILSISRALANQDMERPAIAGGPDVPPRARLSAGTSRLDNFVRSYAPSYRLAVLTDPEGRIVACNTSDPFGRPIQTARLIGRDLSGQSWFQKDLRDEPDANEPIVEGVREDSLIGEIFGGRGITVCLARGIYIDHHLEGVLAAWVDWAVMEDLLRETIQRRRAADAYSLRMTVLRGDGLTLFAENEPDILRRSRSTDPNVRKALYMPVATSIGFVGKDASGAAVLMGAYRSGGHSSRGIPSDLIFLASRDRADALRPAVAIRVKGLGIAFAGLTVLLALLLVAPSVLNRYQRLPRAHSVRSTLAAIPVLILLIVGVLSIGVILRQARLARESDQCGRIIESCIRGQESLDDLAADAAAGLAGIDHRR